MNHALETEARWNGATQGQRYDMLQALNQGSVATIEESKMFARRHWNQLPVRVKASLKRLSA